MPVGTIASLIVSVITIVTFVGGIIVWINLLKFRLDEMTKSNEELKKNLIEATKETQSLITTVKAFASTQEVINKFTSDTLAQIVHRLDMIEDRIGKLNKN